MNLFELFVKIGVDDQASNKLKNISGKLGDGLKTAAKVGVAAVGTASAAIAGLTKSAVEGYAAYEQLTGGVETLFGAGGKSLEEYAASMGKSIEEVENKYWDLRQANNEVLHNADKAFQTAGLSANQYMETVTSFSASLIQSLGGDTIKAAEYADMAIIDMADNANKMGTSIGMIQNAYQGFAKQNYTMLDNLKLGYGGTQAEMYRLLQDAQKLDETFDADFSISSKGQLEADFADIVKAIHIVQDNMGIAGATADEAAFTIEGSVNSMKAAWSNLVTGLADDQADVDTLMDNFINSVKTVTKNIAPVIGTALNGIGKLIKEVVPVAMQYIPQIIGEFLPTIGEAAIGIVASIGTAIFDNIDQILEWGQNMLDTLLEGITSNAGNISGPVTEIITKFGNFILENLPEITIAGLNLLGALVKGIIDSLPELLPAAVRAVMTMAEYITNPENLEVIISLGLELIKALVEGIENSLDDLISIGEDVVNNIKDGISNAWEGLKTWFNNLWDSLFKNRTVDVDVNASRSGSTNSNANGISYVPYDGYYSVLHEGERVLTAKENKAYNSGATGNTSGITIIQNIQAVPQTPVEFAAATEAYFEQARWAFA